MKIFAKLLCLLILPLVSFCQTSPPSPSLPAIFISTGASYNTTTTPGLAAGFMSIAFQVGGVNSRTYSITTTDVTRTTSSVRTGMAYALLQMHGLTFMPHIDGGVTTGASSALGSFSEGMVVTYDLGTITKAFSKYYAVGVVRLLSVTTTTTKPVYEFGFGKSW